jgi:uncharacterized protein YdeI (BOF family)
MQRFTIAAMLAVLAGALLSWAPARAQQAPPTIGQIQANPEAYINSIFTLSGQVTRYVDENEFLLSDGTGELKVDPGPPWYQRVDVPVGATAVITGQIDRAREGGIDFDACRISTSSRVIEIRDCSFAGPPPWAGGPNRGGDDRRGGPDRDRGDDDDRRGGPNRGDDGPPGDDFYGFVESRPAGVAGTWVISGRSFVATEQTRLATDDGPLNVGTCVSVEYEGNQAFEIESEPASDCGR